jgi:hypothetical protein
LGIVVLEFTEERVQFVHARICLLRARFQQIEELLVVAQELANGKHDLEHRSMHDDEGYAEVDN